MTEAVLYGSKIKMMENLLLVKPFGYIDFPQLISYSKFVMTQSIEVNPKLEEFYADYETIQAKIAYEWLSDSYENILELGCSSGYFTQKLTQKGQNIFGLDINAEHIEKARRDYPNIKFDIIESEKYPYQDDTFDAIVMLEVYEHVENREKVIEEVNRILKPGGTLILTTPNTGLFAFLDSFNINVCLTKTLPKLISFLKKKVQRYKNTQYINNLEWHRHYSLADLKETFGNRFKIEKVHRGGLLFFPLFAILRSIVVRMLPFKWLFQAVVAIMNLDGRIRFGPYGYNLAIKARKV